MNTVYVSLLLAAAIVLVAVAVMRRRAHRAPSSRLEAKTAAPDVEMIWQRGGAKAESSEPDSGKRAFIRQLALGSVASMAGWVAARGTNIHWAEKMILARANQAGSEPMKAAMLAAHRATLADRPWHQDDHVDYMSNHYDMHYDDATGSHTDENSHGDTTHGDQTDHNDDNPHNDETFHDHIDEQIWGEGWEHWDENNVGGHGDGPYHVDDSNHFDQTVPHTDEMIHTDEVGHADQMIDFVDHGDFEE